MCVTEESKVSNIIINTTYLPKHQKTNIKITVRQQYYRTRHKKTLNNSEIVNIWSETQCCKECHPGEGGGAPTDPGCKKSDLTVC